MKKIIFLLLAGFCAAALAQTAAKKKEPMGDTDIVSEHLEYREVFDANGGLLVYSGHVRVENLRIKILCDRLVTFLPKNGEPPNRVEAQTNVVIIFANRGDTSRATCSLAVYSRTVTAGVTNALITLTGNPFIENAKFTVTGEPIIWNLATGNYSGSNIKTKIKQSAIESSGTNSAPVKLF